MIKANINDAVIVNDEIIIYSIHEKPEFIEDAAYEVWYPSLGMLNSPEKNIDDVIKIIYQIKDIEHIPIGFFALCRDRVVGMCMLGIADDVYPGQNIYFVNSLAVMPQYRKYKIGSRLLKSIINFAYDKRIRLLYLITSDRTINRWYRSFGFYEVEIKYFERNTTFLMEKMMY